MLNSMTKSRGNRDMVQQNDVKGNMNAACDQCGRFKQNATEMALLHAIRKGNLTFLSTHNEERGIAEFQIHRIF